MRVMTLRCCVGAIVLVFLWGMLGCNGGGSDGTAAFDLTGRWEGEVRDPSVSGYYWEPIDLTVVSQDGNKVSGFSSIQGLNRFEGHIDGDILRIDSTDIFAQISADGTRIDGTYTDTAGLTVEFYLDKVSGG